MSVWQGVSRRERVFDIILGVNAGTFPFPRSAGNTGDVLGATAEKRIVAAGIKLLCGIGGRTDEGRRQSFARSSSETQSVLPIIGICAESDVGVAARARIAGTGRRQQGCASAKREAHAGVGCGVGLQLKRSGRIVHSTLSERRLRTDTG